MVATLVRTVFAQPDAASTWAQLNRVVQQLEGRFADAAHMLTDAFPDVLAFTGFPKAHWRQVWSNNPQERLNKELRRRSDVVGIFLRLYPVAWQWREDRRCCEAPVGPRVTRHFSVEPSGSDFVRASPLGLRGWPSDLIAA